MFQHIIFDLDGTLVDTAPDLTAAMNHVLASKGHAHIKPETVRKLVGLGARRLIEGGMQKSGVSVVEEEVEELLPQFLAYYAANIAVNSKPYEGASHTLEKLTETGHTLTLCTNKPEKLTQLLLKELGWENKFRMILGGDSRPHRKPNPAPLLELMDQFQSTPDATLMVGDSKTDLEAARNAGIQIALFGHGYSEPHAHSLGADYCFNSFNDLLQLIEQATK